MAITPVQRIFNALPSPGRDRDWTFASAVSAGVIAALPPPEAIDLRCDWWPVGDQGRSGSCVGWATADGPLRWHFSKAGRLAESEGLSVRQVWMGAKELDELRTPASYLEAFGTTIKSALDLARDFGVVPESLLPIDSPRLYQGDPKAFYTTAAQRRIASYHNLGLAGPVWRSWLANSGPIVARLDCDAAWFKAAATGGRLSGYVRPDEPKGHAVAIVGYTPDHFIVRNSWGDTGWGDRGFGYADNAYAKAAFTEAYGVVL